MRLCVTSVDSILLFQSLLKEQILHLFLQKSGWVGVIDPPAPPPRVRRLCTSTSTTTIIRVIVVRTYVAWEINARMRIELCRRHMLSKYDGGSSATAVARCF